MQKFNFLALMARRERLMPLAASAKMFVINCWLIPPVNSSFSSSYSLSLYLLPPPLPASAPKFNIQMSVSDVNFRATSAPLQRFDSFLNRLKYPLGGVEIFYVSCSIVGWFITFFFPGKYAAEMWKILRVKVVHFWRRVKFQRQISQLWTDFNPSNVLLRTSKLISVIYVCLNYIIAFFGEKWSENSEEYDASKSTTFESTRHFGSNFSQLWINFMPLNISLEASQLFFLISQ